MTRRGFIGAIAATVTVTDLDRLLWVPGKKLISIPAVVSPWEDGISLRYIKEYDPIQSLLVSRLNVLYGTNRSNRTQWAEVRQWLLGNAWTVVTPSNLVSGPSLVVPKTLLPISFMGG